MTPEASKRKADCLRNQGYCKVSDSYQRIGRIDRKDWMMFMAIEHAPWDPNGEGIQWAASLGNAEDFYRRIHSDDTITISASVFKLLPSSGDTRIGYRPKKKRIYTKPVIRELDMKSMQRDRPFIGQFHTDHGKRGKTEIKGITFRDLRDCYVRACFLSAGHIDMSKYNEADKGVDAILCENDLYKLDFNKLDPVAIAQNLSCEIERIMGIFPNIK